MKRKFTLIELLVVIAIIAILAAMRMVFCAFKSPWTTRSTLTPTLHTILGAETAFRLLLKNAMPMETRICHALAATYAILNLLSQNAMTEMYYMRIYPKKPAI